MSLPLEKWPLLLCGPILRRVETRSLSVFVALKFARTVELSLYRGSTRTSPFIAKAISQTVPLGKYLHVALVTLELAESESMSPGITYGYDLSFTKIAPVAPDDADPQTST